jgi:hypothetical protein
LILKLAIKYSLTKLKRRNFIRVIEDFACDNCGYTVEGNGYTNHCPKCLCSKHVDLNIPGDRGSNCKGLMEVIDYFYRNQQLHLVHKCTICGKISNNKANDEDLLDALLSRPLDKSY